MNLKKTKMRAKKRRYEEALASCNELLKNFPEKKSDILRTRAYTYALMGDYDRAVQDRKTVLEMDEGLLKDYYLAASNALSLGMFSQASAWLKELLRLGEEQKETWFDSAAYFLLAYSQMEQGYYEEAIANLDRAVSISPDCFLPLPKPGAYDGVWDHNRLRKEIQRRAAS